MVRIGGDDPQGAVIAVASASAGDVLLVAVVVVQVEGGSHGRGRF